VEDYSLPSLRDLDKADVPMDTFLRDPSFCSTKRSFVSKKFLHFSKRIVPFPFCVFILFFSLRYFCNEKSFYSISYFFDKRARYSEIFFGILSVCFGNAHDGNG
jgi:hypothetical protein